MDPHHLLVVDFGATCSNKTPPGDKSHPNSTSGSSAGSSLPPRRRHSTWQNISAGLHIDLFWPRINTALFATRGLVPPRLSTLRRCFSYDSRLSFTSLATLHPSKWACSKPPLFFGLRAELHPSCPSRHGWRPQSASQDTAKLAESSRSSLQSFLR